MKPDALAEIEQALSYYNNSPEVDQSRARSALSLLPRLRAVVEAGKKLRALFFKNSAGEACADWDAALASLEMPDGTA